MKGAAADNERLLLVKKIEGEAPRKEPLLCARRLQTTATRVGKNPRENYAHGTIVGKIIIATAAAVAAASNRYHTHTSKYDAISVAITQHYQGSRCLRGSSLCTTRAPLARNG
jgi:hypothetical protein